MHRTLSLSADTPRRLLRTSGVLVLALTLGACAQLPQQGNRDKMTPPDQLHSSATLTGNTSPWPTDRWWQVYGDSQLNSLIEEALKNSPDMAMAAARLRQAAAGGMVAGAALKPQVSAGASATSERQSENYLTPKSMVPEGWNDYGRGTLNLNWELDFWGRNHAALAAATSQLDASRAEAAQARLTLASRVAGTYADLARLYAERDTAQAAVGIWRKSAKLFAERYANGMETRASVKDAQARLANAEGALLQIDEQIALVRNALAALVGAGPDRGLQIQRPTLSLDHLQGLPSKLSINLLGRRPDLVAARLMVQAQAHRIDQKKAEFYPNVSLSAFIGLQSFGLDKLIESGSQFGSVGPAISLPIFNGGRLRGELKGQEAAYDAAVATYNRTLVQALQQVANAYVSQQALGPRVAKADEAVKAAQDAYRIAVNRYRGELSSYLEVLSAQDTLLSNQRTLADLQARAFTLNVALTQALGGGYQTRNQ